MNACRANAEQAEVVAGGWNAVTFPQLSPLPPQLAEHWDGSQRQLLIYT
jgi:hypothetical protein